MGERWPISIVLLCETVMQFAARARSTRNAEGVRFELTRPFGLPVFKTGAINRSATPPGKLSLDFAIVSTIGNRSGVKQNCRVSAPACRFLDWAGEAPALQENYFSTG